MHDTLKPNVTVVFEETYKDGSPHLHAWLDWEDVFYTQNAFLFDYKEKHPNIGFIKDITKNIHLLLPLFPIIDAGILLNAYPIIT